MKTKGSLTHLLWGASCVGIGVLAYLSGSSVGRAAALDSAIVNRLAAIKAEADADLRKTKADLAAGDARLAKLDGYEGKISRLDADLKRRESDLAGLNTRVIGKQTELASLTGKVEKIRSKPIDLPAGHFTVGQDIRAGRYVVVGDSNFIVNGGAKVNTILGEGGVERFVCRLDDGDEIEAAGENRYYPVE